MDARPALLASRHASVVAVLAAIALAVVACGGSETTTAAGDGSDGSRDGESLQVEVVEVPSPYERAGDVTVYRPEGDGPWPTAVLFAGADSPRSTLDPFAGALASTGIVVATTAMTIGVIERSDFRQLLNEHPDLYAPLVDPMAKRLAEVDDTH